MKRLPIFIFFLPFILALLPQKGNAQFTIGAEFRIRGEFRDGYQSLRDSSKTPYVTIPGRVRLGFNYKNEKIDTRFSLYDAWVFGQNYTSSDTITKNTVNVFEAWFQYSFTRSLGLKIGRMTVTYDNQRIMGLSNWSMWGATHDMLLAQFGQNQKRWWGNIGLAVNNIAPATAYLNSYDMRNNYKYLGLLYLNCKLFDESLTLTFLDVMDAFQKYSVTTFVTTTTFDTLYIRNQNDSIIGTTLLPLVKKTSSTENFPNTLYARNTLGASAGLDFKKWSFFINGFYQFGNIRDGRSLSSYFYNLQATFRPWEQVTLMVGWDQLSGNNFSDTNNLKTTVHGFSTLYGSRHIGYGYMDLFNNIVKDNLSPGLNDLYGRASFSFRNNMSLELTYRWFSIPFRFLSVTNPGKGQLPYIPVKTSLGSEIDLMYVYKPIPNLELNAAYCFFLPTSTMEILNKIETGKSKFAQYAYIMITYKPNLFHSDNRRPPVKEHL